jgi:hypothetical protein
MRDYRARRENLEVRTREAAARSQALEAIAIFASSLEEPLALVERGVSTRKKIKETQRALEINPGGALAAISDHLTTIIGRLQATEAANTTLQGNTRKQRERNQLATKVRGLEVKKQELSEEIGSLLASIKICPIVGIPLSESCRSAAKEIVDGSINI